MQRSLEEALSRRERQALDVLYAAGELTAAGLRQRLPDQPSYSAVRALLAVLEDKGWVKHRRDGRQYVFAPTVSRQRARRGALQRVLRTFFDGSPEQLVQNLLDPTERRLEPEQLARLRQLLDAHEQDGPDGSGDGTGAAVEGGPGSPANKGGRDR